MSQANFNQLSAVGLTNAATNILVYAIPGVTYSTQINSVRMVNRSVSTAYVRAWALNNANGPGVTLALSSALVWDAPIPPGSWLELCDTKIIALKGASAAIWARCDTTLAVNVIVSGMEIIP